MNKLTAAPRKQLDPADKLLIELQGIAEVAPGDPEHFHLEADEALISYIRTTAPEHRGEEIAAAFNAIKK